MRKASIRKKESCSAWAEVTRERGMKTARRRVKGKEVTPAVINTSPVIPVICLPRAPGKAGGRPAKAGNTNSDDHDKVDKLPVKIKKKKKTQLMVKQVVKGSDQKPQPIEKRSNDKSLATSDSRNLDIPGQYEKDSVKGRLKSTSKKQKNQDIVMDLIKQNVLENERLRQKFQMHGKEE